MLLDAIIKYKETWRENEILNVPPALDRKIKLLTKFCDQMVSAH
jgi:hypothetical protein